MLDISQWRIWICASKPEGIPSLTASLLWEAGNWCRRAFCGRTPGACEESLAEHHIAAGKSSLAAM